MSTGNSIRVVFGLGNPGAEHARQRHNAGFWFVDKLAEQMGVRLLMESKLNAEVGKAPGGREPLLLVKPTTYMNRSGIAVSAVLNYYKIDPSDALIVHDELDLPPGVARLKFDGGHGGQKSLEHGNFIARYAGEQPFIDHIGFRSERGQDADRLRTQVQGPHPPIAFHSPALDVIRLFELVDDVTDAGAFQFEAFGQLGLGQTGRAEDIGESAPLGSGQPELRGRGIEHAAQLARNLLNQEHQPIGLGEVALLVGRVRHATAHSFRLTKRTAFTVRHHTVR